MQKEQSLKPHPVPEYGDLHLKGNTIKRLRFFSTMDNESYDDILNTLMDVADGIRRRSVFDGKAWMREGVEYQNLIR